MKGCFRLAFLIAVLGALVLPQEAISKKSTATFGLGGGGGLQKAGWIECYVDCDGDGDFEDSTPVDTEERCEAYCEFSCMVADCEPA